MKILEYTKSIKPGALIGSFTLLEETPFGPRFLSELKLFMKNGHRWIAFPSRSSKNEDGTFSYSPLLSFQSAQDFAKWQMATLVLLDQFCASLDKIKGIGNDFVNQPNLPYKDNEVPF